MGSEVHTYTTVEGRHVKMSAGCKHGEQRDWELWAGVVDIYGFSSWQPTGLQNDREKYSIADSKIIFIRMFLLKHVTVNATTVKRKKNI